MAVVIIGMHRSGTSLTAQILHDNGLYLGKPMEWLIGNESNKAGYFEFTKAVRLNNAVLEHLGGSWSSLPKSPVNWNKIPQVLINRGKDIVNYLSSQRHEWGFKDPRTTVLLPFWKKVLPSDCKVVFCLRHPSEIQDSLIKRGDKKSINWRALWVKYIQRGLVHTKTTNTHFVFYEDYFNKTEESIDKLLDFCGLENRGIERIDKSRKNKQLTLLHDEAEEIYNNLYTNN